MELFNGVVIAAFLQGAVMAFVICFSAPSLPAAKVLGCILLVLALLSFKIILHTTGLWQLKAFHYFPLAIDTTLPALFIIYVSAVIGKPLRRCMVWLSLAPTIIFLCHALVVYVAAGLQPGPGQANAIAASFLYNKVKLAEDVAAVLYALFGWLYCYRLIARYRRWLFLTQSNSAMQEYTWLRSLLVVAGLLVLGLAAITVLEDMVADERPHFVNIALFYTYLAALTWYLSLKGYVLYREYPLPLAQPVADVPQEDKDMKLPGETIEVVKQRVINSMESGKLYLDPDLTLKAVAVYTGYPVTVVSAAINQGTGKNFRTFINEYRVEAVKKQLQNPPAHLSLLGVAIECGFNSEASFYRIFRQLEGMSPNEYLQQQKG